MSRKRIWAIARKELLHIVHDTRTMFVLFVFPIIELVMLGYALNLEIQRVDMGVVDYARSTRSRQLIETFAGSKFFRLFPMDKAPSESETLFKSRRARAILVIPKDFDRELLRQPQIPVQIIIDASDANAATLIRKYCQQVFLLFNERYLGTVPQPMDFRSAVLFNPDMKSAFFFVPGIVALILMLVAALLTSISIAREKELGTMEQLLVSPIRPQEMIFGKVAPYVLLALLEAVFIIGVGIVLFRIPFRGNVLLLAALTTLFIIVGLSLGIMISTRAKTQQVAMMMANTVTLLPTLMLSGLIFPIASMPKWLQYITYLVPARYYLLMVRGVMLKGSTVADLLIPILLLAAMGILMLLNAIRQFRVTLES